MDDWRIYSKKSNLVTSIVVTFEQKKIKWAKLAELQNDETYIKITPFLGNFLEISDNFIQLFYNFRSVSLFFVLFTLKS